MVYYIFLRFSCAYKYICTFYIIKIAFCIALYHDFSIFIYLWNTHIEYLWSTGTVLVVWDSAVNKIGIVSALMEIHP